MKASIVVLPILAALGMASIMRIEFAKDNGELVVAGDGADAHGSCCNQTPCFMGCPVGGSFKVSFRFLADITLQHTDSAGDCRCVVRIGCKAVIEGSMLL